MPGSTRIHGGAILEPTVVIVAAIAVLVAIVLVRRVSGRREGPAVAPLKPSTPSPASSPPAGLRGIVDRSIGMYLVRRLSGRSTTGAAGAPPPLSADELADRLGRARPSTGARSSIDSALARLRVASPTLAVGAKRIPPKLSSPRAGAPSAPATSPVPVTYPAPMPPPPPTPERRRERARGGRLAVVGLATASLVLIAVVAQGYRPDRPPSATAGAVTRATAAAGVATPRTVATPPAAAAATPAATASGGVLEAVVRDTTGPIVLAPTPRFDGPMTGKSLVRIRLGWSGTDAGSGIARYQLQQRVDDGPFTSVELPQVNATSILRTLPVGGTYRYRVRATDDAGNASDLVHGPTFTLLRYQETSPTVTYSGSWSRVSSPSLSGGAARFTRSASNRVTFSTRARAIAWFATKSPGSGSADVRVDGRFVATVDLESVPTAYRQLVFQRHFDATGTHTIEIRPRGDGRIDIDAFAIAR